MSENMELVVNTSIMSPPLIEDQSRKKYYCKITIGSNATCEAFRISKDIRFFVVEH
jgi:hypothetical protein